MLLIAVTWVIDPDTFMGSCDITSFARLFLVWSISFSEAVCRKQVPICLKPVIAVVATVWPDGSWQKCNKTNRKVLFASFKTRCLAVVLILSSWCHTYFHVGHAGSAPWSLGDDDDDDVTCLCRLALTCFCPCSILSHWHVCFYFYVSNKKWHQCR